jgi:hypothetical protein
MEHLWSRAVATGGNRWQIGSSNKRNHCRGLRLVADRVDRRRRVLLVADGGAPAGGVSLVVDLEHGEVGHEPGRSGAVPVLLVRLEEHPVARVDRLDGPAAPLAEADALEDVDRLAVRMRVPGGASAAREVNAARA